MTIIEDRWYLDGDTFSCNMIDWSVRISRDKPITEIVFWRGSWSINNYYYKTGRTLEDCFELVEKYRKYKMWSDLSRVLEKDGFTFYDSVLEN